LQHIETRLCGMEDAETEEVKPSPSIHLPFNTLEPIDLAFDLTLAPRQGTRSINGRVILLHALGETFEFSDLTAFGGSDPILQFVRSASFEDTQEVLTELIGRGQIFTGLTHLIELPLLMSSELLFGKHKEPGCFLRGKPLALRALTEIKVPTPVVEWYSSNRHERALS
jgi:hypothetical protein